MTYTPGVEGSAFQKPFKLIAKMADITIEMVKNCIAFPDGNLKNTLLWMCDCWYAIALRDGSTPAQAASIALDNLHEKLLELAK